MPIRPPVFRPAGQQSRTVQKRDYDRRRRQAHPWRRYYGTREWQARRLAQLIAQPCCERCAEHGLTVLATIVHHVMRHHGDWTLFITGDLQSLCKPCHDSEAQAEEAASRSRRG